MVCDLTDIVGATLEHLQPITSGREIQADFPAEPLLLECDPGQVETVVLNLIENALKYSPEGSPLLLKGESKGGMILLSLEDCGPGIPEEAQTRIFEKFYRLPGSPSRAGTGLGLAICKAIIETHGGQIGVRNAEGNGAVFWFTLPAMQEEVS